MTIAPGVPAARKWRTATAQPTTARSRLAAIRALTSEIGDECTEASRKTAALLTQPASGAASWARSAAQAATSSSAASPISGMTLGPAQSSARGSRSMTTTVSFSWRSRSTTALPMPRPPPVTTYETLMT
nr:hypothetical protein [Nonomuraea solani]